MAIEVRSGVSAGPALTAAYAGGQGMARGRLKEEELRAMERRRRQADQQEFQADQAEIGRHHQLVVDDERQDRRREDYDYQYTQQQKRQSREFDEARATIMGAEYITEEERQDALHQIDAKQAGIKPIKRRKGPSTAARFETNTYTDPKTGNVYPIDPVTGVPGKSIYTPPSKDPTFKDRIEIEKVVQTAGQTEAGWNQERADAARARMTGATVGDRAGDAPPPPAQVVSDSAGVIGGLAGGNIGAISNAAAGNATGAGGSGPVTPEEMESIHSEYEDKGDNRDLNAKGRAIYERMTQDQRGAFHKQLDDQRAAPEPDKPSGKGKKLTPKAAKQYKAKYGTRAEAEKAARAAGWSF